MMEFPDFIQNQPYDARSFSSAAVTRGSTAPQYATNVAYTTVTAAGMVPHYSHHHSVYTPSHFGASVPSGVIPIFANNYIRRQPLVRMIDTLPEIPRTVPYARRSTGLNNPVNEHHSQNIKPESRTLSSNKSSPTLTPSLSHTNTNLTTNIQLGEVADVDTLMKAIQSNSEQVEEPPQQPVAADQDQSMVGFSASTSPCHSHNNTRTNMEKDNEQRLTCQNVQDNKCSSKKRYQCVFKGCDQSYFQKSHLEIHARTHTGVKPYVSPEYLHLDMLCKMTMLMTFQRSGVQSSRM
jgi:hypothetical protein